MQQLANKRSLPIAVGRNERGVFIVVFIAVFSLGARLTGLQVQELLAAMLDQVVHVQTRLDASSVVDTDCSAGLIIEQVDAHDRAISIYAVPCRVPFQLGVIPYDNPVRIGRFLFDYLAGSRDDS